MKNKNGLTAVNAPEAPALACLNLLAAGFNLLGDHRQTALDHPSLDLFV